MKRLILVGLLFESMKTTLLILFTITPCLASNQWCSVDNFGNTGPCFISRSACLQSLSQNFTSCVLQQEEIQMNNVNNANADPMRNGQFQQNSAALGSAIGNMIRSQAGSRDGDPSSFKDKYSKVKIRGTSPWCTVDNSGYFYCFQKTKEQCEHRCIGDCTACVANPHSSTNSNSQLSASTATLPASNSSK
jgi:hypothetical protein